MFCACWTGISCELGNRKHGTGDRQEAFTCEKPMFCAVWTEISSMHIDVSTTRVWRPKDVKTSESETVDGQNIQTLHHPLC